MCNYLINNTIRNDIKNSKKIMIIMSVVMSIILDGCTAMNDSYDCPIKNTASCVSLQAMDRSITAEQLQTSSKNKRKINKSEYGDKAANKSGSNSIEEYWSAKTTSTQVQDISVKIWLAPYKDDAGIFHGATYTRALD